MLKKVLTVKKRLKINMRLSQKASCVPLREAHGSDKKLNTLAKDCAYLS